jgi:hypothetical protein
MLRRYQFLWAFGVLVVLLVGARIALPYVVEDQANKRLMALPDYDGHVEDVDMALWRGAYRIDGIEIVKTGGNKETPFFKSDRIDLSVEWRSLLRGDFVASCDLWRPNVNLVQAANKQETQLGAGVNWHRQLERAFPFRFNTIRVTEGIVTFRAPAIRTEDALKATNVNGEITNMTNVADSGIPTFAGFKVTATVLGNGSASVAGAANPLARTPTFDVNLTVKGVELPRVNPWLREYIKADAESGEFELYTELAAADGRFRGYAKPIMRKVNIYSSEEQEKNPFKRLWEGIVDIAANMVEDEDTGQVAARIPLKGTIEDPEAGIMETIASVLRNAFVSAFARSLEGSISIRNVKKNLAKVGNEKEKEKEEKES